MTQFLGLSQESTTAGDGRGTHPTPTGLEDRQRHDTIETVISNLCAQLDRAEDKAERWRVEVLERRKENIQQSARIKAQAEALRPFAEIGAGISEFWDDERRAYTLNLECLKVRHLRRAVAMVAAFDADSMSAA